MVQLRHLFAIFAVIFHCIHGLQNAHIEVIPGVLIEITAEKVTCNLLFTYHSTQNPEQLPNRQCFEIGVPESYENSSSALIRLHVRREMISNDGSTKHVIVPPNGVVGGSSWYKWENKAMLLGQDVIVYDQRGSGLSKPFIWCQRGTLTEACVKHWAEQGHDLEQYNTLNNARDLEAIRLVLGYEKINFYAFGYGSLLSIMYMRHYPDHVNAAILQGVPFPSVNQTSSWKMLTTVAKRQLKQFRKQYHPSGNWLPNPIRKFKQMLKIIRTIPYRGQIFIMSHLIGVLQMVRAPVSYLPLFVKTILGISEGEISPSDGVKHVGSFPVSLDKVRTVQTRRIKLLPATPIEVHDPRHRSNKTMQMLMTLTDGYDDVEKTSNRYRPYSRWVQRWLPGKMKQQHSIKKQTWAFSGDWKVSVPVVFIKAPFDAITPMEGVDSWLHHFDDNLTQVITDKWTIHASPSACTQEYMFKFFHDPDLVHVTPTCYSKYSELVVPAKMGNVRRKNLAPEVANQVGQMQVIPSEDFVKKVWFWNLKYDLSDIGLEKPLTWQAFSDIWERKDIALQYSKWCWERRWDEGIPYEFADILRKELNEKI